MPTRHVMILGAAALLLAGCGRAPESRVVARAEAAQPRMGASAGVDAAPGVVVDVAGRVRRPGVYRLAAGARVHEAIRAAGGATADADLSRLNRAAVVVDGQQVLIGSATVPSAAPGAAPRSGSAMVSINSATAQEPDALPGIGPVTAAAIVADRMKTGPFASLEDLDRVSGVGPATVEALRDVATV